MGGNIYKTKQYAIGDLAETELLRDGGDHEE